MPETAEELQVMLFGDKQEIEKYDYIVSTGVAAGIIWHDLQDQQRIHVSAKNLRNELYSLASKNVYRNRQQQGKTILYFRIKDLEERRRLRDKEAAETEAEVEIELDRLVEEYQQYKGQMCRFHYSDNDGEIYEVLEHGDVFQNLRHVRISHH
jgi:hypothetical protein